MGKKTTKKSTSFLGTSALTRPLFALGAASVLFGSGSAYALDPGTLPQNPNVVGGKDAFSQSGNTLNVKQSTNRTVIDWRSFDIGSKAQVNFAQPGSSSIAVNRINGSTNPTDIEGGLHANGQVWILNPNGVFFGKTARVDAAGIVASTANINDKAFMAGSNTLQMTGADHGSVSNAGNITVGANGLAAFVAPSVRNSGTINATVGRVALAAGTTYTLDLAGDHLVELGLGSVKAVVDNSGRIVNPGGTIALTAKAAGQVVNSVVNVSGVVSASSATKSGGSIILGADTINTTKTASITANAGTNGTGGTITTVANKDGNYAGTFSATGGSKTGDGGKIETSGHSVTIGDDISIDTRSAHGILGNWIVDPIDIAIVSGSGGDTVGAGGSITEGAIENALNTTSLTITTNQGIGGNGDISLQTAINATGPGSLTLVGRHLSAASGSDTISLATGALTLDVNYVNQSATPGGTWINDALKMIGTVAGGSTINLGNGTYTIASGGANYVSVGKSNVTISGQSESGTIIDARNASSYGIRVIGGTDGVTLENFTLWGVNSNAPPVGFAGYGIKAEDTTNLTIENVTSKGAYKAQFDLNGVRGATLNNLTADGSSNGVGNGSTKGASIGITDSQNVLLENSSTTGGSYGGVGIYQSNKPSGYTYQANNITIAASNTFAESNPVYMEDESATNDFANITVAGFSYVVGLDSNPADTFKFFQTSKANAEGYLNGIGATSSGYVEGWTGTAGNNLFSVDTVSGNAMSIQAAINAAAAGATITVGAGTYTDALNIGKNVDIEGAGSSQTFITPTTLLTTGVGHKYDANVKTAVYVHDTSNVTINNVTINANNLGANAVVFWNNASGSITNSLIENPANFTGIQTGQDLAVDATSGHTSNITVSNVTFQNWNKNAIDAVTGDGTGANGGNINLTVNDSTFTGHGATSMIAQNGILLWEAGGGTVNGTVDGSTFSNLSYNDPASATAAAILVYGSANGTLTVSNSTFASSVQEYISAAGGSTNEIDATNNNSFGGVIAKSTDTLAQLYTIENKLIDSQDDSSNGMVRLVDGQVYVVASKDNIQGGIDGASSGDTVNIQAGTYTGQVVITKDLDIIGAGAGQTIIDATDSMAHTFTGNGSSYHAVVSIEGGNVSISDLTVDGLGKGDTNNRFLGIGIHNANATISSVDITGIRNGGVAGTLNGVQAGTGLEAFNDDSVSRSVTLTNSTVEDFQKNATAFIGKNLTVDVEDNTFTGAGNTPLIAQNGVEFFGVGGTVTGTIKNNTITDISYANSETASSDILLWNANGTNVQGNTITGTGNTGSSLGVYVTGSSNVTVTANTITNFEYGMEVDNASGTAASVTAQNNVITGNAVAVDLGYDETDTSTVNAYNNDLSGNLSGIELESAGDTANFSGNWWGTTNANTIAASMTGADASLVDFSPFLTSGTDTSVAAGFQGNFSNLDVTALGGGGTARIEEGVADVTAGGTVNVLAGDYTLAGELDITKSLTLNGAGATTNITSTSTGYGINVTADNVSLKNFTYHGPTGTGATYGIKVTPDTGAASDRLLNFDIENVTILGGYRTGLDLNGVVGATIKNVSVSNIVHGNGIALTDSANVTITGSTTTNNAWGGLALYQTNAYYNQQLNNISVDGTNTFNEANGVYEEDQSASLDMGSLTLAGYTYADIDKSVANDQYTFFEKTKADALNFGVNVTLNGGHLTAGNTYVEGWTGTAFNNIFEVASGLTIQAAENAAAANGTIDVASGTYAENVSAGTQLTFNFGNVNVTSFTLTSGAAGSSLNGNLTATNGITSAGAVSLGGNFTANSLAFGAVTLTGNTALTATGNATVASVTGAGNNLSITGAADRLGNVAGVGALAVTGPATLTGTSYAANSLAFGAITLTGNTALTATGNTTVASVTGAGNNLSITGASDSLGNVAGVGALAVTGPATLTGTSYAANSLNFGAITLTGNTALTATGNATVASVTGGGKDLSITGASDSLGNVAGVGALAVTGPATLTGNSYVAGSETFGAVTLTSDTTLDTSAANGAIVLASVDGTSAGGQALSLNAGKGTVSLGNAGATTRLGALTDTSATTLTGSTYKANSFVFGGDVTLTAATTTLNTTQSSSAAGDITFNGDIFGKTDGGQSLTLVAGSGSGAASANGDITLQNAGTTTVNLNNLTVTGDNFTALTVDLAGNYNSLLTGNQVFAADTLNVKGDASSVVGGNASGHIVSGGDVSVAAGGDVSGTISGSNVSLSGDDVNSTVTASNSATVSGNTVEGSYTADTVSITAHNNVDAAVNTTDLTLSAANGSVDGTWTTVDTNGSGVVNLNGQTTVGVASDVNPNQLVVEGFTLPAGTTIGANGALILPQGVLLGLLSPGGGKPKMILVHSVQQLGELLAGGYSVIVIDLSNKDSGKPLQLASN